MLEPPPQLKLTLMPALVLVLQLVPMPLPMLGLGLMLRLKPELIIDLPHQLVQLLELAAQLMVMLLLVQPIEQHRLVRPIEQHQLVELLQPPMLEHLVIVVFLGLELERLNHQQLELPVVHLHHKAFDQTAIAKVVPSSILE